MRFLRVLIVAVLGAALLAGATSAFSKSDSPRVARVDQKAAATAAKKIHRCHGQTVKTTVAKAKRIRLKCLVYGRGGKLVFRRIGGARWLSREIVVRAQHGRLRGLSQRSGKVTYVPKRGFAGRDHFSFVLTTARRGRFRGRVTVRVLPRRNPKPPGPVPAPSCSNGSGTVAYGGTVELTLRCSGKVDSLELLSAPQDGRLGAITGDTVAYRQTAPVAGSDEFSFRAVGPGGPSAAATMTIEITPPPAPTCQPKAVTTRENVPIDIEAVCSGVDIDYEVVSDPSHGSLTDIGAQTGQTLYTPSPSWFSPGDPPAPDMFRITATNPGGAAPPTPIDVTVLPDAPVCKDVSTTTLIDRADSLLLPCGSARSEKAWEILDGPDHGTLGPIDQTTGRVAYTPDPGYVSPGPPDAPVADSFTFKAVNTGGQSGVATATVLTVPPPPTCDPLDVEVSFDTPQDMAADCTSEGGAEQRYELVDPLDPLAAGTLTPDAAFATNGKLEFSPTPGYFTQPGEAATFGVRAVNSGGASTVIQATLQVDEPTPSCDDYYGTVPADETLLLTLPCEELPGGGEQFSITDQPSPLEGSVSVLDAQTGSVEFTPAPGYFVPEGGTRVTFEYQSKAVTGGATSTGIGHIDVLPPPPTCSASSASALYMTPVEATIDCTGPELTYSVVAAPEHGELGPVSSSGETLYTPAARYAGPDSFLATASNRGGTATPATASLTVRPWEMRAIGDSVTAAFGFYGNGQPMSILDLLDCKPPTIVNDRCSSNSSDGPSYAGTVPHWTADYGLGNGIAWPAQFALAVQGGGHVTAPTMFRNQAVTGSAPSDWLSGGALAPDLATILADEPDMVTMTMGANPLLSDILLTGPGEECAFEFTVADLEDCVQPFIDSVQLPQRLQALYTEILQGTDTTQLVIMPYHLAIPYANLFSAWQLEVMSDMINGNVANAVEATQAALPAPQADRLSQIEPASSPQDTNPVHLPRFDIGTSPTFHDDWSGSYDCGWWFPDVDGPSHQSVGSQAAMAIVRTPPIGPPWFCFGEPWILSTDTGIHPNVAGHTQFAETLENFTQANDIVPPLP